MPIKTASPTHGLAAAASRLPQPVFALLDGAWFEDLPAQLTTADLPHRSLFREGSDAEVRLAGPWLTGTPSTDNIAWIERVLSVVGEHPAIVFWSCPAGEAVLHRHLRSLNEVMFPRRDVRSDSGVEEAVVPTSSTYEPILFRHWDPRVLTSVAPMLDVQQSARLLGPAQGIALNAGYGRGISLIQRPE